MKNRLLILSIVILMATTSFASWYFLLKPKTVLFLCVRNTFRSQMAEAYFNKFAKEKKLRWQAKSAGFLKADKINEKAVILMKEEGIDISDKKPKLMTDKMIKKADKIVVVCQECEELGLCLVLPKDKDIDHWGLPNPAEMELDQAREIRNKVKEKVINLIEELK
jgi:arsenate reductase